VLLLPEIAKLYGIMVDDLFKKQSVAYDNYAQRLSALYEISKDPEDFLRCRLEYQKLMKSGELDLVLCGHVHKPYLKTDSFGRGECCAGSVSSNGSMVEIDCDVNSRTFAFKTIEL
jgi:UDP-2,3-diacylglucosamine pyrophosphatase LpxH